MENSLVVLHLYTNKAFVSAKNDKWQAYVLCILQSQIEYTFFFIQEKISTWTSIKKKNQFLIQTAMNTAGKQYLGTSSILQNLTKWIDK